jgi:hypothetical protein
MAVGINPNLPGWWSTHRGALNPLFDDYRQYAFYFRYRGVAKPELAPADYRGFGGGAHDQPPDSTFSLNVPAEAGGQRPVTIHWDAQSMYETYQSLLDGLAQRMSWTDAKLSVGEDLSYANMVACPSAKWVTSHDPTNPTIPPMTTQQRDGIVAECFSKRKHFPRQLFQSLPAVILVFSNSTARVFVGIFAALFTKGDPRPDESVEALLERKIVLRFGEIAPGVILDARVIFAPHPTGNPQGWQAVRTKVVDQLHDAVREGRIALNPATKHLTRTAGSCVFCTMLDIGGCDYAAELRTLPNPPEFGLAAAEVPPLAPDKPAQEHMLKLFRADRQTVVEAWSGIEDEASNF